MRFERMIAIVMLLLKRGKVSGKELAELFEVSLRTIYRDVEAINASGIPIATSAGVGGGISIMEQYKTDKGIFTTDDITAMLMGLGVVSGTLKGSTVANALAKLKSFIPQEQLHEIDVRVSRIIVDLSSWMSNDAQAVFDLIKDAIYSGRLISFSYIGQNGKPQDVLLEPHRLAFKANHWYVQGYSRLRQNFRLYKLRRIIGAALCTETFILREAPHPFAGFIDNMGGKQFRVKLLVDKAALNKMLDYCSMEDITETEDGKYVVNFDFMDDDYGYGILLSFGDQLACLAPDYVRIEMKNRLLRTLRLYE